MSKTVRITVHAPEADSQALARIAAALAEPGMRPNESAAFRHIMREFLRVHPEYAPTQTSGEISDR